MAKYPTTDAPVPPQRPGAGAQTLMPPSRPQMMPEKATQMSPSMRRIPFVGAASNHQKAPVFSMTDGKRVQFTTRLRSEGMEGQVVRVNAPVLTTDEMVGLVQHRLNTFQRVQGSRESPRHAVIRKAIAAQGRGPVEQAKAKMNPEQQMELDMMLSPSSHTQGLPFEEGEGAHTLVMSALGQVAGLETVELADNDGQSWVVQRQGEQPPMTQI